MLFSFLKQMFHLIFFQWAGGATLCFLPTKWILQVWEHLQIRSSNRTVRYSPTLSLTDKPIAPYRVGASLAPLAPSKRPEILSGSPEMLPVVRLVLSSHKQGQRHFPLSSFQVRVLPFKHYYKHETMWWSSTFKLKKARKSILLPSLSLFTNISSILGTWESLI